MRNFLFCYVDHKGNWYADAYRLPYGMDAHWRIVQLYVEMKYKVPASVDILSRQSWYVSSILNSVQIPTKGVA